MPSIPIKWSDNTEELKRNLLAGLTAIEGTEAAAKRLVQTFQGDKLSGSAQRWAIAITQVGGATKLTATEQERANAIFERFIEKQAALGKAVPAAITALNDEVKALIAAREASETTAQKLERTATSMQTLASAAKGAGTALSVAITGPLAGIAVVAVKSAMDFETAFAGVRKTVSGSPAELQAINDQFRAMAKTTPATVVELSHIGEQAGQLGVAKENVAAFTKTIVDISSATNLTADEAGESFAKLANVMKMPQAEFSNLGSAVVALGNFGASTEQEMLSMAQRIAAAGATAGMTAPQVLGIANALSSVGIEAEAGGTAISRVINKISMDVASGSGKLREFAKVANMSADEFSVAWRENAGKTFAAFMQGLADARARGGDELLGLIRELGLDTNVRLVNAFMSAANAGSLMKDSIELGTKAFRDNTEVARASEERYKTFANQTKILRNNVNDAAIELGNALLPILERVVHGLIPMIDGLKSAATWFKDLPGPVQDVALVTGGFLAIIGPGVFLLGSFAGAIGDLSKAAVWLAGSEGLGAATKMFPTFTGWIKAAGDASVLSATQVEALGLAVRGLSTALAVAGAAFVGWEIGRFIAQITGADKAIADLVARIAGLGDVRQQEQGAKQDSINLAIRRGAAATIDYAAAVKFNDEWVRKLKESTQQGAAATDQTAAAAGRAAAAHLTLAERVKALTDEQRADIATKHAQHESIKAIADETGIARDVIQAYLAGTRQATTAANEHAQAVARATEALEGEKKSYDATFEAARKIIEQGDADVDTKARIVDALDKIHKAHGVIPADLEAWRLGNQELGETYQTLADKVEKANDTIREGITLGTAAAQMTGGNLGTGGFLGANVAQLGKTMDTLAKLRAAGVTTLFDPNDARTTSDIAEHLKGVGSIAPQLGMVREEADRLEAKAKHADEAFGNMAATMAQLGQITGGVMGGIISGFGQIIVLANEARKANQLYGGSLGVLSAVFAKKHPDGTPVTDEEKWAAGVRSAAAIAQGAQNVWAATGQYDSGAKNAAAGAMAGAQAGAAFGPAGIAIGAAAGLVVGLIRGKAEWARAADDVGRDFGVKIDKALSDQIVKDSKDLFNGSRQAASLYNLGAIIQQGGGANADNVPQLAGRLRDVFVMVETHQMTIAQAQKVLNDTFGELATAATDEYGFLSGKMREIIDLDERFGTHSKAVADYLKQQSDIAVQGASAIIASLGPESKAWQQLADDIAANSEAIDKAKRAGSDISDLVTKQTGLIKTQSDLAAQNKQRLEDMGMVAVAAFASALQAGKSFAEAIKAAGPGLADLKTAFDQLGISTDNAALKVLLMQGSLLKNNPTLIQGVSSLGQTFAALANTGMLNKDTFEAMERAGYDMYVRVQSEVAKMGGSTRDALLPMQDYLHQAQEAAERLGIPLDANTQMLIDQSKEAGIWKDKTKSATDILTDAIGKLTDKLQIYIDRLLGIPTEVNTDVNTNYTTTGAPPPDVGVGSGQNTPGDPNWTPDDRHAEVAATGGEVGMGRVIPFARYMLAGGVVPERADYAATGRLIAFVPRGNDTVPIMAAPREIIINEIQQGTVGHTLDAALQLAKVVMAAGHAAGAETGPDIRQPVIFQVVTPDGLIMQEEFIENVIHNKRNVGTILRREMAK